MRAGRRGIYVVGWIPMLERGVDETVRGVEEHASRRVRRAVRRCSALGLQRAFIGKLAQRSRRRASRIDELVRRRWCPGSVVQVHRLVPCQRPMSK